MYPNSIRKLQGKVTGSKVILSSPWFNQSFTVFVHKYKIFYQTTDDPSLHHVTNSTIVSPNSLQINNVQKSSHYRFCVEVIMRSNWNGTRPPSDYCVNITQSIEIELSAIIGAILGVIFALLLILLLIIISRYQHKVARKLHNNTGGGNYMGPGYSNDENNNNGEYCNDGGSSEKNGGKNKSSHNSHNNHYGGSGFFSKGGSHSHGGLKLGRGYHSGSGKSKSNNNNNQRRRFDSTFDSTFDSIAMREEDTSFYDELLLMSESSVYDMSSYYGNAGGVNGSGMESTTADSVNNCSPDNPAGVYCVAGSSATVISQSVRPPVVKEPKPVPKDGTTVQTIVQKDSKPNNDVKDAGQENQTDVLRSNKEGNSNASLPNSNPTIQRQNSVEILHETSIDETINVNDRI